MKEFKPGDKLRCINVDDTYGIEVGKIYTCKSYCGWPDGEFYVTLEELKHRGAYFAKRFELVTDYNEDKMNEFKPGDKLLCIERSTYGYLEVGKIYTCKSYWMGSTGEFYVNLEEFKRCVGYSAKRFELIDNRVPINVGTVNNKGIPLYRIAAENGFKVGLQRFIYVPKDKLQAWGFECTEAT